MIAYVDGKWTPAEEARISVLDHGLLYGDGVFEGIRVYGGVPFLLDEHLDRLAASARALVLELPAERAEMAALCHEAAGAPGCDDGYLRLVVTRGAGALGVSPHTCARASLIVIAAPLALYPPERYRDGVRLVTSSLRRSAQRRAAAAGQEPQLPHERAGVDRGAPPGRRRGRAPERAGPDRRVHRRQPLPRQRRARADAGSGERSARRHHARARLRLLGEQGIECVEAPLTPADAWTADELFLTGHRRRDRARLRDRRTPAAARPARDRARARRLRRLRRGERARRGRRGLRRQHLIAPRARR